MSRTQEQYVTWTCDHCKRKTKAGNTHPKGWRHLVIAVVIEDSHVSGSGNRRPAANFRGDACGRCVPRLRLAAMRMAKGWKP